MKLSHLLVGGILLLVLGLNSLAQPGQNQPPVEKGRIQKLIQQLGSGRYAERERAARELLQLGAAVLEELRQATQDRDIEVSRRAGQLVQVIEEKVTTAVMLQPKKVRLAVKDLPVPNAVTQLAKLSGYKIEFNDVAATVALAERKITLDTGEVTFWEALDQLTQASRLIEVRSESSAGNSTDRMPLRLGRKGGFRPAPAVLPPDHVPETITLLDGPPRTFPTAYAGSVRVRMVSASQQGDRIALRLEAAPEPRLQEFRVVGTLRIDRVIDDQGQELIAVPDPTPPQPEYANSEAVGVIVINGQVITPKVTLPATAQRTATVHLKKGEKSVRSLRELSGVLNAQVLREVGPVATVDNILKAPQPALPPAGGGGGKDGHALQLHSAEKLANGDVKVQVTVTQPNEPDPLAAIFGGNIQIRGNVIINGVRVGGSNQTQPRYPRLLDTEGREFKRGEVTLQASTPRKDQVDYTLTVVYHPPVPQAEPARLNLFGLQPTTFAVPFTLKNVPLP